MVSNGREINNGALVAVTSRACGRSEGCRTSLCSNAVASFTSRPTHTPESRTRASFSRAGVRAEPVAMRSDCGCSCGSCCPIGIIGPPPNVGLARGDADRRPAFGEKVCQRGGVRHIRRTAAHISPNPGRRSAVGNRSAEPSPPSARRLTTTRYRADVTAAATAASHWRDGPIGARVACSSPCAGTMLDGGDDGFM